MVASNATNSAAVDNEGNVWVWGAGKYGLLGDHIKDVNYQVPKPLYITTSGNSIEEVAARDAFTRSEQVAKYRVRDISLGQYHMVVVAVDSDVAQSTFKSMDYAMEIFTPLKHYLLNDIFRLKVFKHLENNEINVLNERIKIEYSLKYIFKKDKQQWPAGKWVTLYNLLFEHLHMTFSESLSIILERLQSELASDDQTYINLKQLRDQLLGFRVNTNVVFGWGLADERLCAKPKPSDKAPRRYMRMTILSHFNSKQVERVACGNSYSLALTHQGEVYAWGIGKSGSLGLGEISTITQIPQILSFKCNRDDSLSPDPEKNKDRDKSEKIIAIASGQTHCLALTEYGGVYSWGNGQGGRLGHGDSIGQNVPEKIRFFDRMKIVDIECGDQHSGCINQHGQVYVWGVGMNGRLGLGTDINFEVPTFITEFNAEPCSRIFFGMNSSFAITKSSELYVWGSGSNGKLGLPSTSQMQILLPRKLFTLSQKRVAEFSAGPFHTLALTHSGLIYAFGNSREGKLGIQLAEQQIMARIDEDDASKVVQNQVDLPTLISNVPKFSIQGELQSIFKSYAKFQAYSSEGVLQADDGDVKIFKVIQTACGDNSSYYLSNIGQVFASGANDRWQCSDIEEAKQQMDLIGDEFLYPDRLNEQELNEQGGVVIPVAAAKLIREVQVMQHLSRPYNVPILKNRLGSDLSIKHLSAGANHVLVVGVNGQVYGWGDNEFGQLGLGRLLDSNVDNYVGQPALLQDLIDKKILMTACGRSHSLFLTVLGQVYSAGYNEFGQLGVQSEVARLQMHRDDQYGSILNNYLYAKTKSSPQRVELTNIRYIAAGDSHSLAISDETTEGRCHSDLFSWGWGAYGQLGHSKIKNYYNLDRPKKVKFRSAPDTKIAFVACGSKHTMCLDLNGRLWYWGNKISVGIREPLSKVQFEPVYLAPSNSNSVVRADQGFVYVDASAERNLVISYYDQTVYFIGQKNAKRNKEQQLQDDYQSDEENAFNESDVDELDMPTHFTRFKKISQKSEKPLTASIVSIGPNHSIATELKQSIPYSWGDNTSGQLGLGHNKNVPVPGVIGNFSKMITSEEVNQAQLQQVLQENERKVKAANPEESKMIEGIEIEDKKFRFPIQIEFQKQHQGVPRTNELLQSDIKMLKQFNKQVSQFHTTCVGVNLSVQNAKSRAQDGFITRVHKFPTPINELVNIQSQIPKSIGRNRQVFEAIFTYLQAHPCYMIRWIQKTRFFDEPEDLRLLLFAVFGKREMKNNQRVLKTLVTIAKSMFDAEYSMNNFKELTSVFRTNSAFRVLFGIIFEMQTSNLGFMKSIIAQALHQQQLAVQEHFRQIRNPRNRGKIIGFNPKSLNEILKNVMLTTLDNLRKRIELHGGIHLISNKEMKDQNHLTIEILSLLDYVFKKLVKLANENLKTKPGAGAAATQQQEKRQGAEEEKEAAKVERADESIEQIQRDKIFPFMLDLLFEPLLKVMDSLTYEDILYEYWDLELVMGVQADGNIFNQKEGQFLIKQLAANLKMYFRGDSTDAAPQFIEILSKGCIAQRSSLDASVKHLAGVKFREEIGNSLFTQASFKPYNLEYVLVEQLFETCIESANPHISATVSDIIYVYNALVHNEHFICASDYPKDPLRVLIRELGSKQISLDEEAALSMRVNLQLSVRFLYERRAIVKCHECLAPVIETMIPDTRFKQSHSGRAWRCKNRSCQKQNAAGKFDCIGCSSSMPADLFGKDLVFRKFERVRASYNVKLLKFVLKNLPLVEEGQDLVTLIEAETQKMVIETQADGQKHEKLMKFKQMIEEYSKSEGRGVFVYLRRMGVQPTEQQLNSTKMQTILAEKVFIEDMLKQLVAHAEIKKQHQRLLKDYQSSLIKLNQLPSLLKQRTVKTCLNLNQILHNAYTGVGSKFLIEQIERRGGNFKQIEKASAANANDPGGKTKAKDRVWAGSLHIDLRTLGKKKAKIRESEQLFGESQKSKLKRKTQTDLIKEYFDEITTVKALSLTWDKQDEIANQKVLAESAAERRRIKEEAEALSRQLLVSASDGGAVSGSERAITGTVKFIDMERDNVIQSADAQRYDREILKNSDFQFNDNGGGGFLVQLVYNEPSVMPGKSGKIDNAVLESFEVSRENLNEMRRNYAFQSTIIFGMLQFRVHELVRVVNHIVSMNDIFSSLSFDDRGFQLKKDPAKEVSAQNKSKPAAQRNVVIDDESDEEQPKAAENADKKAKKNTKSGAATEEKPAKTKGKKK